MRVFILHQLGRKTGFLQKRLQMEGVRSEIFSLEGNDEAWKDMVFKKMAEANIGIFYMESPDKIPSLDFMRLVDRRYGMPIIVLDEHESLETKRRVLKSGASVYFSAPFSFPDIAMKLKLLLYKKKTKNGDSLLKFSDLKLDFSNHTVARKHKRVLLRSREFSLLEFLLLNCKKVMTRNTILEHVWDRNGSLTSNTVDVHMSRLRQKLDGQFRRKLIHTVHGVGYKLDTRP